MSENTLTLRGGPRDGAVIGAPSCATIVSLEFVSDRAAPFTVLDLSVFIQHVYDGQTGQYRGVQHWPAHGPWSHTSTLLFPAVSLFPRWEAFWQAQRAKVSAWRARLAERITP